jgi:chloramphenicol 3-O phosphotransferase
MARSRVIILNGVGSVGKSSTARALQTLTAEPFLHVAMDAFIDMLPPALLGHPDGLLFEPAEEEGMPSTAVRTGPAFERVMSGMRRAIAAMAAQGNNLIVDDVMLGGEEREYRSLLAEFEPRFVGLFAPLDVLERRERDRGDRMPGLARWQYTRVQPSIAYDLEIDTSVATAIQSATLIRDTFDL